ncbi:hypothetical protein RLV_0454 (plasmid) [Rhizobium leguminosarum bv. viciae]|nr:hypothetical protein RLV_0454 [Rhizobium leguminosarum bv. viciae]
MIGTLRVHDDPVDPIDRDDRGIERERPEGDAFKCCGIHCRIRIDQHQTAEQRLCFGRRHADMNAGFSRGRVGGRYPAFRADPGDDGDRLFRRNRPIGATNTIRRQIRPSSLDSSRHCRRA